MPANKGIGTTIQIGATTIGTLTSIVTPEISADTIESTTLDTATGYKTFVQGIRDGGEVSMTGYFDPSDTGQTALKTALDAGTVDTYTITFPFGTNTWTFTATVTKYKTGEANLSDLLSFEITVKISGKPNLGSTASGGLTALTLSGTAGALSPTFNNAKLGYAWSFTTDGSITVTPTAASHTISIYVDGVFFQTVTSGATSNAIGTFTAASSKKIDIIVYEAGKAPKTYSVMAIRTS